MRIHFQISFKQFPKRGIHGETEDDRNYDWGDLLYHWKFLLLTYYLNKACFPGGTTIPHDQTGVRVSISKAVVTQRE